jgi:hypothetical protein
MVTCLVACMALAGAGAGDPSYVPPPPPQCTCSCMRSGRSGTPPPPSAGTLTASNSFTTPCTHPCDMRLCAVAGGGGASCNAASYASCQTACILLRRARHLPICVKVLRISVTTAPRPSTTPTRCDDHQSINRHVTPDGLVPRFYHPHRRSSPPPSPSLSPLPRVPSHPWRFCAACSS